MGFALDTLLKKNKQKNTDYRKRYMHLYSCQFHKNSVSVKLVVNSDITIQVSIEMLSLTTNNTCTLSLFCETHPQVLGKSIFTHPRCLDKAFAEDQLSKIINIHNIYYLRLTPTSE